MQDYIDREDDLRQQAIEEHKRKMAEDQARLQRRNRCIASCCYVAGAGAFGTFIRWLQVQTAFTEDGLADKSVFNLLLPVFVVACVYVFHRLLKQREQEGFVLPEDFKGALVNRGLLFTLLRWAIGGIMCIGALLLFGESATDKNTGMVKVLAVTAFLSGLSFPLLLTAASREGGRTPRVCRLYATMPVVMFSVWLIVCYKTNAINSEGWSYVMELLAIIAALLGFFRMAGFAFGVADTKKSMFYAMLGGAMCVMALADERHTGMQIIFLASALMLGMYGAIMTNNFQKKEKKAAPPPEDGFERL